MERPSYPIPGTRFNLAPNFQPLIINLYSNSVNELTLCQNSITISKSIIAEYIFMLKNAYAKFIQTKKNPPPPFSSHKIELSTFGPISAVEV